MNIYEKMMSIDRRILFILIALSVIIPLLKPLLLPVNVTKEVENLYGFIDKLKPGDVILFSLDYDPSTMAECHPMALSILRHCFRKGIKPMVTSLARPEGLGTAEMALTQVVEEYNKKNGEDYVFLGYKPVPGAVILAMGEDFRLAFPNDFYGTNLEDMPMMGGVKSYKDIKIVITISGSGIIDTWVIYAGGRYGVPIGAGVTAVMATGYYRYLQSGQLVGLLGGLKGAAEYEKLIEHPDMAIKGMDGQNMAHLLIVLFIILGNIGYFLGKKAKVSKGR
jgi:hypothetical protein